MGLIMMSRRYCAPFTFSSKAGVHEKKSKRVEKQKKQEESRMLQPPPPACAQLRFSISSSSSGSQNYERDVYERKH